MAKLKPTRFFQRFGFRVLLFNAILLVSIIVPSLLVRDLDYKQLTDRLEMQRGLFTAALRTASELGREDWNSAIERFPRVLYRQRFLVFDSENRVVFDSGELPDIDLSTFAMPLLGPSPYVDPADQPFGPATTLQTYLAELDVAARTSEGRYVAVRSVPYGDKIDRVAIAANTAYSRDGDRFTLVLCQSVVDLLLQGRAVKERLLVVYVVVVVLAVGLTILLSALVTRPLRRLHDFSRTIVETGRIPEGVTTLRAGGEIGAVCSAVQSLLREQQRQYERFREFSADIVHELRTPLAAIRASVELAAESTDESERADHTDRVHRRVREMERLMDEIRLVGTIESRNDREQCVDLIRVLRDVAAERTESAIALWIEPDVDRRVVAISCDDAYRVVANLVSNAVGFSPVPGSVRLSARVVDEAVRIEVADRGPGIAPEVFPTIVNRFVTYRAPSDRAPHSGLGLAIVNAIVQQSGGSLRYRNPDEGGALFTCEIPASKR